MASSQKQKKKAKAPHGRPQSTAAISQPSVEDTSQITALSSFSPDGNHFAFLSLAVDKHRLRVYSTTSGQSVAEHTVDSARVTAMAWSRFNQTMAPAATAEEDTSGSPSKKRRRKKESSAANDNEGESQEKSSIEVVLLGLSDGTILIFSPSHGRILRTLSYSSSPSSIVSLANISKTDGSPTLWASSADGTLRFWDTVKNDLIGNWKPEDRTPFTVLSQRPSSIEDDRTDVLAAHHLIRLLSIPASEGYSSTKPTISATFTGHASPIRQLQWDNSKTYPTRFISLAETDRFLYIWETPESSSTAEGRIVASIPLDSDARSFSFSKQSSESIQKQTLLTLSASGKLSIFPIPSEISTPSKSSSSSSSKSPPQKLPTLLSRSVITTSSKASNPGKIVSAAFVAGEDGKVRIARIVGGIRPVFDLVGYLNESGEFIKEVVVEESSSAAAVEGGSTLPTQRYSEANNVAVSSGAQLAHDTEMDDVAEKDIDGALDVDLAELSLGQRLTALSGEVPRPGDSDSEEDEDEDEDSRPRRKSKKAVGGVGADENEIRPAPANTLTRTLIQALHSSDMRLLETCLAHTDSTLILSTVRRLPAQLSIPLIQACVERLGRGKRAGSGGGTKGRGGAGASAQRGMGLVRWVRCVLVVHSGFLMTIPDLVARLSSLHSTLTARLALQDSLLSLSGRLDMVLSQIELRSSAAPAPLTASEASKKGSAKAKATKVTRYVEGESESSEDDAMEVEVERDDEEGSIEDVELGGVDSSPFGDDGEEAEDEDEDEEGEGVFSDEEDDEDEGVTMNGFIDDEAEEYSEEDDDDESE